MRQILSSASMEPAWHSHGRVQFGTGEGRYVEYDELEILIALGIGALVIITEYSDGRLHDRSLAHRKEPLELRYMQPEIRVLRLPDRNSKRA